MKLSASRSATLLKTIWLILFAFFFSTFVSVVYSADPSHNLDFDGDGKADIAVYREGNTERSSQTYAPSYWYYLGSSSGFGTIGWGQTLDVPIPADYVGDGKTDPTVFRWFEPYATPFDSNNIYVFGGAGRGFGNQYGRKMGRNFTNQYNAGKAELGEFRHINIYADSNTPPFYQYLFYFETGNGGLDYVVTNVPSGQNADSYQQVPVPDDYNNADGTGKSEIAVFNTNTGCYHIWLTNAPPNVFTPPCFGSDYTPAPGDYDRDGWVDYGVFKATGSSSFEWQFISAQTNAAPVTVSLSTGWSGIGKSVVADYDGDGKTDFAVAQYSDLNNSWNWTIRKSGCPSNRALPCSPSTVIETFGLRSDTLLASPYFNDPWY